MKIDSVVLSEKNSWTHIFTDLDSTKTYSVTEATLDDYTVSISSSSKQSVITNTKIKNPEKPNPKKPKKEEFPEEKQTTPAKRKLPQTGTTYYIAFLLSIVSVGIIVIAQLATNVSHKSKKGE